MADKIYSQLVIFGEPLNVFGGKAECGRGDDGFQYPGNFLPAEFLLLLHLKMQAKQVAGNAGHAYGRPAWLK